MMPVNHSYLPAGRLMTAITIKTNKHLNLTIMSFFCFIRWSNHRRHVAHG